MQFDVHELRIPALTTSGAAARLGWALALVIGFGVLQLAVGFAVGMAAGIGGAIRGMSPDEIVAALTASTGMLVMVGIIELALLGAALFCALGFGPRRVGWVLEGTGRSLALLTPLIAVLVVLLWLDPSVTIGGALTSRLLGLALVVAALIGLAEELVFRGILVGLLGGSRAPALAIVGSATIFGAVHVLAPEGGLQPHWPLVVVTIACLFGVPFAAVYLRTGSIMGLVVVHATWDAIILADRGMATPVGDPTLLDWMLPIACAAGYGTWFALTAEQRTTIGISRRSLRRERSDVDWDALGEESDHPDVLAQIRRAVAG